MPRRLLLPACTLPPNEPLLRRHTPGDVDATYRVFRDCLRWEFGFTCSICLLHELDVVKYGGEGWGTTQIEHIMPRSHRPDLIGSYSNLLYICRLCNGARSDTDIVDHLGRRLLDPTSDVWSKHFHVVGDALRPLSDDAEYTEDVYNMNDARKAKLRRKRREFITNLRVLLESREADLRQRPEEERAITRDIRRLKSMRNELPWIPSDKPMSCRCMMKAVRSLPRCYLEQARAAMNE